MTRQLRVPDFPHRELLVKLFGESVYLVGGPVRDLLRNADRRAALDIDLLVTGLNYEEIAARLAPFGKTNTVGRSFAVIKFSAGGQTYDIAVPRRDRKRVAEAHDHRNFEIETGPQVTLEEDLSRRDFTCNSMALRLADGQLSDPFDGAGAIRRRMLAMTSPDSFRDDPLRVLRAARFAARFEFSIDRAILDTAQGVVLGELSAERVAEELCRLLLEAERPGIGLDAYWQLSVLDKLYPELAKLALTIQDAQFHPETDAQGHHTVWAHTVISVDLAAHFARQAGLDDGRRLALLLAALLHDVGKAETTRWEYKRGRLTVTSQLHDARGTECAGATLERLRLDTRSGFPLRRVVQSLIRNHHRIYELYRLRAETGFRALARLIRDLEGEDLLLVLLDCADRLSREAVHAPDLHQDPVASWFFAVKAEHRLSLEAIRPLLAGRDLLTLGFPPGPEMGRLLKTMYERQLDGEFATREEGLALLPAAPGKKRPSADSAEGGPP